MLTTQGIIGTDEAGRGPLAGPVTAAAVVLPPEYDLPGLADSKKMTERNRQALFPRIQEQALAWAIYHCTPVQIDTMNILGASLYAMEQAVREVVQTLWGAGVLEHPTLVNSTVPFTIMVDGNQYIRGLPQSWQTTVIGGDAKVPQISAASVLAKVSRDAIMCELHAQYPQYGFDGHKGYPSKAHIQAIKAHGYCPEHRRSFHVKALSQMELEL
jgi:ribonuclease HII